MRTKLDMPPTPSSSAGSPSSSSKHHGKDNVKDDADEIIQVNRTANTISMFEADRPSVKSSYFACPTSLCGKSGSSGVLDPQGLTFFIFQDQVIMTFFYRTILYFLVMHSFIIIFV